MSPKSTKIEQNVKFIFLSLIRWYCKKTISRYCPFNMLFSSGLDPLPVSRIRFTTLCGKKLKPEIWQWRNICPMHCNENLILYSFSENCAASSSPNFLIHVSVSDFYIPRIVHTLQRKSHLCIPSLGIARPQPQFPHSCVCERFIYSQDRSTYFLQQNRETDGGNI